MAERNDCRISSTMGTSQDLIAIYAEEDDMFYGDLDTTEGLVASTEPGADEDELARSDEEGDHLQQIADVADNREDIQQVMISGLDDEKAGVHSEFQKGCQCPENCYSKFTEDEAYSIRLQMLELQKFERDMLVLGKLQVMANTSSVVHARQVSKAKRRRVTYQYAYDGRFVCKAAFCFLHCIGEKVLRNLQRHLKENGVTPRHHGNSGRLPSNAFSYETARHIVDFITNYATVHGLPQPAAQSGRAGAAPIYLPASEGYNIVHQKYIEACSADRLQPAKYHAFRCMWLQCVPHIKFMTPRTDVCHYCENFRAQLMRVVVESEKIQLSQDFQKHVKEAQMEREYYLACISRAETCSTTDGSIPQYGHYTFDFAQQLQVPYHARQVGPLYFKSPLKVQLFGVCNDASKLQVNYLFAESQSIGINGTKAHGPNAVISMLHHFFEVHSCHEPVIHLHADNCVGQNKNRFILGYLAWRVLTGLHHDITLSFMRVGHTRCFVDGNFGLIKQTYRSADVDTVEQLSLIVSRSSRTNTAQMFPWEWREWDKMLGGLFGAVKGIRKYQHFHIAPDSSGTIVAKVSCTSEDEVTIPFLKRGVTTEKVGHAALPPCIPPPGLSEERRKYLYEQIRPHVWAEFRDITCPHP